MILPEPGKSPSGHDDLPQNAFRPRADAPGGLTADSFYYLIRWLQNEAGRKNREFIDGNRLSLAQVAVDADLFRLMLASGSMNVTPGQHLCRCIQKHRPDLLETALSANRDEDLFYPDLQDDTPFPDKNGTPSARQWDAPEIRALAGILSEVCPGIATEWVSVLKRGIPSRRNGSRSELYQIAFAVGMTAAETQKYLFLSNERPACLRNPLDLVCIDFLLYNELHTGHGPDGFVWEDVLRLLREVSAAAGPFSVPAGPDAALSGPDTRILGRMQQELLGFLPQEKQAFFQAVKQSILANLESFSPFDACRGNNVDVAFCYARTELSELERLLQYLRVLEQPYSGEASSSLAKVLTNSLNRWRSDGHEACYGRARLSEKELARLRRDPMHRKIQEHVHKHLKQFPRRIQHSLSLAGSEGPAAQSEKAPVCAKARRSVSDQANRKIEAKLFDREDLLTLSLLLITGLYELYQNSQRRRSAVLECILNMAGDDFLVDRAVNSILSEFQAFCITEPDSPDRIIALQRMFDFVLAAFSDVRGTCWYPIYLPSCYDRFYVLAALLRMGNPVGNAYQIIADILFEEPDGKD